MDKKETERGLHTKKVKVRSRNIMLIQSMVLQSNVCVYFCASRYSNKISGHIRLVIASSLVLAIDVYYVYNNHAGKYLNEILILTLQ